MTFAEKLIFLMSLTSTSNKQLAIALNVDPSLVSLLRTARRGVPKNPAFIRAMALYFAKKCVGNYQRIALSEAMGRKHLQLQMETEQLASILFGWLTDRRNQVGEFLNTFERFSIDSAAGAAQAAKPDAAQKGDAGNYVYYGSEGKRGAIGAIIRRLFSLDTRGTVLLATDESLKWLAEDTAYLKQTREQMMLLLQRGFRLCRIAAPIYTVEQAFDSLSQLMPLYLTGQVESYYYPRLRDNVYHRTLIALPDVAAVFSSSIGAQTVSHATVFTQDARFVNALAEEFHDFLAECRPMMTTYSTAGNSDELLRCIAQFESDNGNRIQQSTSLSSITAPPELIRLAVQSVPEKEADKIVHTLSNARSLFCQSLAQYEVVDIHSLASVNEVRAGSVPVSVAYLRQDPPIRYTPELYAAHLESILGLMEQYKNYHAVLRPRDAQTHALMVKDGRQALLLRPGTPLMVFEVSQPNIAEACREYLEQLVSSPLSAAMQRQETVSRLRAMIHELRRSPFG